MGSRVLLPGEVDWYTDMCDEREFIEKIYSRLEEELGEKTTLVHKEDFRENFIENYNEWLETEGRLTDTVQEPYEYLDGMELSDAFDLDDYRISIAERLKGGLEDGREMG